MPDQPQHIRSSFQDEDCAIYSSPVERREKLRSLNIPEELLVEAVQRGVAEKLNANIFDPKTAGGWDLYRFTTRYVREGLFNFGWRLEDQNNIALVQDPENGTVVIVCSGDSQTGQLVGKQPKTKRSHGDVFMKVTEIVEMDLFGDGKVETRQVSLPNSSVWLLLHYHVLEKGHQYLRVELSKPLEAEGNTITRWSDRIILHVPLAGEIPDDEIGNDSGPEITPNIEIRI